MVKKRTTDPQFHDDFVFDVPAGVPLLKCTIRVSVWHQSLLADDTFLGQVRIYKILFIPTIIINIVIVRSTCPQKR